MKIFDFLYYYLYLWFNKSQKRFNAVITYKRVSYGLGIIMLIWLICIDAIVEFFIFKSFKSVIPIYIQVLIAISIMWLFDHIYVKNKRFEKVVIPNFQNSSRKENIGIIISIFVVFMSLFITLAVMMLLHLLHDDNS